MKKYIVGTNEHLDKIHNEYQKQVLNGRFTEEELKAEIGTVVGIIDKDLIIENLFNYCKQLEERVQKLEDAHVTFGMIIPDPIEGYLPLREDYDTPLLDEDIEDTSLEPIRFGKEEAVEPTKLHQKARPANDWALNLANDYLRGNITRDEIGRLHEKGELTLLEVQFILDYVKPRSEV